jgi:hypothetical protein
MNKYYCWAEGQSWHDGEAYYTNSEKEAAVEFIEDMKLIDATSQKHVILVSDHSNFKSNPKRFVITCDATFDIIEC